MAEIDQDFVEYVVKALVNHPEDVHTERKVDNDGVLITLHVNPQDMGYVIGKNGQTAIALRILLRTVGAKMNIKDHLRIYEPEGARVHAPRNSEPLAPLAPQADNSEVDPLDVSALDDIKL